MCVNLQVVLCSSWVKLSSEAGEPLRGGGTTWKDAVEGPRSVLPRRSGGCLLGHVGQSSTSTAAEPTARPPPAAPQQ